MDASSLGLALSPNTWLMSTLWIHSKHIWICLENGIEKIVQENQAMCFMVHECPPQGAMQTFYFSAVSV